MVYKDLKSTRKNLWSLDFDLVEKLNYHSSWKHSVTHMGELIDDPVLKISLQLLGISNNARILFGLSTELEVQDHAIYHGKVKIRDLFSV